ncbi:MAG: hypothetical protein JKY03_08370, partial [Aureispira sp.]|nr:hypothetical protein [Aureispira sp.]
MLHRFFVLTFLFLTYASCLQATTFPKYQEIVETLIRTTKTCEVDFDSGTKLKIEKRADGYWVGISTWDFTLLSYTINQRQLFWSATTQKYNTVAFNVAKAQPHTISKNNILTPLSRNPEFDSYNMNPFFGYEGWYHHVIKWYSDLEKKRPLEDFELYSLARAYSMYAQILLANTNEVLDAVLADFLTGDKASPKRIKFYNLIENKSVNYFHKTYLKNPNWKTIVGNIFIKYSNEVVTQYHTLALHTKHKDALNVFKGKDLYTKELLTFAANTLKSCPTNAILWTTGDNTSLPMFYLQQVKGIRKDVLVTNAYQLSSWRYINYVTNPKIHTNPILLDIAPAIYNKSNNDYIAIKDIASNLELNDLKLALSSDKKDRFFSSKKITLPFQVKNKLSLDLKTNYLIKNEWISLFIFAQNQRPFCFTVDFKINNYSFVKHLNIKKHLYPVGLVYQLAKKEHTITSDEEIETSYDIITNQLKWFPIKTISEESRPTFYYQLGAITILAMDLYNNDKNHQVVYLLDLCRKISPMD